jgi:hypothetical protein
MILEVPIAVLLKIQVVWDMLCPQVQTDISKDNSAYIFMVKQSKKTPALKHGNC